MQLFAIKCSFGQRRTRMLFIINFVAAGALTIHHSCLFVKLLVLVLFADVVTHSALVRVFFYLHL